MHLSGSLDRLCLTGMDKQMHTGMILIDLETDLDTLEQEFLLEKMKYIGSLTSVIKPSEYYLSNRKSFCLYYLH